MSTEHGLVPKGDGWFVLNARDTHWWERTGRGVLCEFEGAGFEGATDFMQLGINLTLLGPGEPMAMYHWEADQEDFLVLSGEAILVIEGRERRLRAWDFVHCPPGANHTIVGGGTAPCLVLAVGARDHPAVPTGAHTPWTRPRSATAPASSARRRSRARRMPGSSPSALTRYRDGWLGE